MPHPPGPRRGRRARSRRSLTSAGLVLALATGAPAPALGATPQGAATPTASPAPALPDAGAATSPNGRPFSAVDGVLIALVGSAVGGAGLALRWLSRHPA